MKINGGEKSRDTVPLTLQKNHLLHNLDSSKPFCLENLNHLMHRKGNPEPLYADVNLDLGCPFENKEKIF
jgi:hypothetical protein